MSDTVKSGDSQTFKFKKPSRKPLRQRLEVPEEDATDDNEEQDIL